MTMIAAPIDPRAPEQNWVVAGGVRSPGRAYFTGLSRPYNWQVQEGYGLQGGFVTFRGRGICKFTLTIELFKPEDFIQWSLFSKVITPTQPVTPLKPFLVDMQHPLLAAADIKTVAVEDAGVPVKAPNGDRWVVAIKLIDYRPPLFALAKADKSIPSVDKGKPIPAKTDGDLFLQGAQQDLANAQREAAMRGR